MAARPLIPALAALAALAGCGSGSPAIQAVDAATEWLEALRDEEIERACGMQLPRASRSIRARYLADERLRGCPDVMRAYRARFSDERFETILGAPLEAQSSPSEDEVGVFPAAKELELAVILMRRVDGAWKVASAAIPPE